MKKILWLSEANFLNTGYAVYTREVLSRLYQQYDIMELASYYAEGDPRATAPWKMYPVLPPENRVEEYNQSPTNQFGEWVFEQACLQHKPDVVISIRDVWMDDFVEKSPYRPYYQWIYMPTIDREPQQEQWLSVYANADALLSYQDWSAGVLKGYNSLKYFGSAPPCASPVFKPQPKIELKSMFGLQNLRIIGTVMRNQRRKLYPNLFHAFRQYLDESKRNDVLLYCHTSYPDAGWDIPHLLLEYKICSKVLFTYICGECHRIFPLTFHDALTSCKYCGSYQAHLANVQHGADDSVLAKIMNLFDVYIQYACLEGFGMPLVEAASCGIPVMATDYTSMKDIIRKLDGFPIKVNQEVREPESNGLQGIPSNDDCVRILTDILNLNPEEYRHLCNKMYSASKYYNWDTTAATWSNIIDILPNGQWHLPPRIHHPHQFTEAQAKMNTQAYVRWLIMYVLGEPEKLGSYLEARLIRDLNYGFHSQLTGDTYQNELAGMSVKPRYSPFNRELAYQHIVNMCNKRNYFEQVRGQHI